MISLEAKAVTHAVADELQSMGIQLDTYGILNIAARIQETLTDDRISRDIQRELDTNPWDYRESPNEPPF